MVLIKTVNFLVRTQVKIAEEIITPQEKGVVYLAGKDFSEAVLLESFYQNFEEIEEEVLVVDFSLDFVVEKEEVLAVDFYHG